MHSNLMKKRGLYASWHKKEYSQQMHWMLFFSVAFYSTFTILGEVAVYTAELSFV
ncbi:MAG: hypothetical protein WDZ88_03295 [Candidatus Paceibacterota bacterium]